MILAEKESRRVGVKFEELVVVRLKIQEQSELNFASRTIQ